MVGSIWFMTRSYDWLDYVRGRNPRNQLTEARYAAIGVWPDGREAMLVCPFSFSRAPLINSKDSIICSYVVRTLGADEAHVPFIM